MNFHFTLATITGTKCACVKCFRMKISITLFSGNLGPEKLPVSVLY